ncbi:MAG: CopG family transcriptional regulator [Actinomycetota bacterium]
MKPNQRSVLTEGPGTRKVSVSLPAELTDEVRRRAGARGFSKYVAGAVRRQVERDDLAKLVADMDAANGPVPAEVLESIDGLWPDVAGET